MEANHLHLLVNHAPIFGTFFGFILLTIGFIAKRSVLEKTGLVIFIFSAFAGSVAYFSGGDAAGVVKHFDETSRPLIKEHAQLGKTALYLMIALGIAAAIVLVVMWRSPNTKTGIMKFSVILLSAVTFGILGYVAFLGGKIRRPELRSEVENQRNEQFKKEDAIKNEKENPRDENK